ncbi:twin-arginine translocase TatA/TatE family subunit [Rickettsiales endosymbiont of Stachyamoeba lipophora]|nr:twin-arginine translocase TatA/TatE family subunit [Rickettsiales endosymbiont of Stachyamoeba lipophora]AZL15768.1 twin-arginine translocase TatA/TatE family subunit [Rickettsiales endosymbiont of Stachyamoeba lipophora]
MGMMSLTHWIVVLLIVVILFGAGKLPKVMGDVGKGIRNFKAGLNGEEAQDNSANQTLDNKSK